MPNVKSVISIADEFSGPLLRLSATALDSGSAVETLNEAVNIGKDLFSDYTSSIKYSAQGISKTISDGIVPGIQELVGTVSNAGREISDAFGASEISDSLTEMTLLAFDGSSAFDALFQSVVDQKELVGEFAGEVSERVGGIVSDIKEGLLPSVLQAKDSFWGLGSAAKDMFTDFNEETVMQFTAALLESVAATKGIIENISSIGMQILSTIGFIKKFKLTLINAISMGAFNHLKDAYIKTFKNVSDAISRSLEDISITDKLDAMYGEAGGVAKERAYQLANELGESARMVTELSAKAAYEGIGTEHFERMMKLADKIGKLSPGESTESAASALIDNIKNGQDASSLSRMLGGGQMMERQLRRSGYERALHRGDLDEALKIAEKIAEQAGLTDENYQKATDSLSNNYKRIQNIIENLKQRMSESFANTLAPSVKKVREFLESEKFKKIQSIVDFVVKKVGEFVNGTVELMIDNIHWLGIFLGIGIVSKTMLIFKLVGKILMFASPFKGILTFAFKYLTGIVGKVATLIAKKGALAAIKIAGPWVAAGAAVAGITYGIYKLSGTTKSFTGWLKGVLAAAYQSAINSFTNIFIFFDRLGTRFKQLGLMLKAGVYSIIGTIKSKVGDIIGWIIDKLVEFVNSDPILKKILDILDIDTAGLANSAKEWAGNFGKEELSEADKIAAEIDKLGQGILPYVNATKGVIEAYESEGANAVEWLKKLFKQGEEQTKDQKDIKTDTNKLRQFNEQEEELKWLKAFSDRQIMSAYNSQTTNNRTINMNGVSQNTMAEAYRRNRSTIPARAAM